MSKYTRKIYRKRGGGGNGSSIKRSRSVQSLPKSSSPNKSKKTKTSNTVRFSPKTYKGYITHVPEQAPNSPEKLYNSLINMDIYEEASNAGLTTSPVKSNMLPMAPSSKRFTPQNIFKIPLRGGKMRKSKKSKKSKKTKRKTRKTKRRKY